MANVLASAKSTYHNQTAWTQFCGNTLRVTESVGEEIFINIGQHERKHQSEQSAVPDQQDVIVCVQIIVSYFFDKWKESILNI